VFSKPPSATRHHRGGYEGRVLAVPPSGRTRRSRVAGARGSYFGPQYVENEKWGRSARRWLRIVENYMRRRSIGLSHFCYRRRKTPFPGKGPRTLPKLASPVSPVRPLSVRTSPFDQAHALRTSAKGLGPGGTGPRSSCGPSVCRTHRVQDVALKFSSGHGPLPCGSPAKGREKTRA